MPFCLFCPVGSYPFFPDTADLTNHMSRVHSLRVPATPAPTNPPVSNIHRCHICSKSFSTADGLTSHRRNKQHLFVCSVCNRAFVTSEQLEGHRLDAHSRPEPGPSVVANPSVLSIHKCHICPKSFTTAGGLASHRQDKQHLLVCSICNQAFVTSEQLEGHRSDAHSRHGPGPSVVNGVKAPAPPSQAGLPSTKETCSGPSCNQCNERFRSWGELNKHVGSIHGYPCEKCAERFPSMQEWSQHFSTQHKNQSNDAIAGHSSPSPAAPAIRPTSSQSNHSWAPSLKQQNGVVCGQCNKKFKGNEALQAHVAAKHPSGPSCRVCQHRATSAAALEAHVNEVHCCTVCQDSIVRDTQTLEDHMVEHTHPFRCKTCETMYRSEEELSTHFTSSDRHPLCAKCDTGFVDDATLKSHVSSIHPPSRMASPRKEIACPRCPELLASQVALEAHLAEVHHPIFECHICGESYSAQSALTDHISMAHSCPVCDEGVYVNAKSLEVHLEEHRAPFRCVPCGTRYAEEELLFQHYRESSNDVHPLCMRCDLGFEGDSAYNIHVVEVHRPTPCEACEGLVVDENDLPLHYMSSKRHPMCETCQLGFKNRFDYAEHGASQHPDSHCYLCRWQFDSSDALQSHIRHFFNHPKCDSCDLRFADVETYQHHLFAIHCPKANDNTAVPTQTGDEHRFSLPSLAVQYNWTVGNQPGRSSEAHSPLYASSIPLPPSASGYSSPTSQPVHSENSYQPDTQSCSSTLTIDQPSPREGELRKFVPPSLNVDTDKYADSYQEFNHSPLSMVPAVGTPLLSSAQTIPSFDYRSPFSPRPNGPPAFRPTPAVNGVTKGSVHFRDEDGSDSSFARSPPLISPGVKLPSPVSGSPTSSGWTSDSGSVTKLSLNSRVSSHPKISSGADKSMLVLQVYDAGNSTGCMPASTSPISPESAGISVSAATRTPEYLREARAYLPLTHPTSRVSSPSVPHSPTNSSPILSSTGLAVGDSGRRREVRFDENIMSETVWDRESTSSDPSLDIPVPYQRPNGVHARKYGASKLPRFSSLRRRRFTNGKQNHLSAPTNGRTFKSSAPSYHCRACLKDSCDDPTTTTCGHLFCYECISNSVMDDPHCPVCNAPTLLYCLFRMDLSA